MSRRGRLRWHGRASDHGHQRAGRHGHRQRNPSHHPPPSRQLRSSRDRGEDRPRSLRGPFSPRGVSRWPDGVGDRPAGDTTSCSRRHRPVDRRSSARRPHTTPRRSGPADRCAGPTPAGGTARCSTGGGPGRSTGTAAHTSRSTLGTRSPDRSNVRTPRALADCCPSAGSARWWRRRSWCRPAGAGRSTSRRRSSHGVPALLAKRPSRLGRARKDLVKTA